ncbi:uncharacterized protein LOC109836152 [Asparagus officinalis]|uniref:uncharacterized protein LOC109836152 n=1 Tax=Asparagus officinalis TaxID=4686 RepID=UPI00098DF700|nr:uncharacterized protein LOC109836152 [Asparagus officinalis]
MILNFFHLVRWRLGDENLCRFWQDKWSGDNTLSSLFPRAHQLAFANSSITSSHGLFINNSWKWHPIIRRGISEEDRYQIEQLYHKLESVNPLVVSNRDEIFWYHHHSAASSSKRASILHSAAVELGLHQRAKSVPEDNMGENFPS